MLNFEHVLFKCYRKSVPAFLKIHQALLMDFIGALVSVDLGMQLGTGMVYLVSIKLLWPQSHSLIQKSAKYCHRNWGFLYAVRICNPSLLVESLTYIQEQMIMQPSSQRSSFTAKERISMSIFSFPNYAVFSNMLFTLLVVLWVASHAQVSFLIIMTVSNSTQNLNWSPLGSVKRSSLTIVWIMPLFTAWIKCLLK